MLPRITNNSKIKYYNSNINVYSKIYLRNNEADKSVKTVSAQKIVFCTQRFIFEFKFVQSLDCKSEVTTITYTYPLFCTYINDFKDNDTYIQWHGTKYCNSYFELVFKCIKY